MPRNAWNFITTAGFTPTDPDVAAYFAAAEAAGATYLNATKEALDTWVLSAKNGANPYWADVRRWNPMLADGGTVLGGVAVVLNDTVGDANVDTLNNYVSGDWDPAAGLQGNGTTTYTNTGWTPSQAQMELGWLGLCYRGTALSSGENLLGTQSSTDILSISTNGGSACRGYYGGATGANGASGLDAAIWSVYRTSPTNNIVARNNVTSGTEGGSVSPLVMSQPLAIGARRTHAGSISLPLGVGERVAGYIACNNINADQRTQLQSDWAAFNAAIGR